MILKAALSSLSVICREMELIIDSKNHIIFLLSGEVGAGKTALIKEYVKFKGLNYNVTSPTFNILHQYGENLFHYDLYNRNLEDLLNLGLFDLLGQDGIHFVEWGNKELFNMLSLAYDNVNFIKIINTTKSNDYRIYEF
ncbi:tRNA (adenosine(37)-N6)-threonylcarbamoyltransferase complex ATPase subunit type 1 TsaE [Helicobacter sp. MIT 14-3879]|uniref:tRNA (adenosine(37)-N6)-threonylcarbamoyltransferase complex ATPase subunit type 1 TsaE n=1 Tax=Helicobacter sp. MIT 14-3879 TaxID=2040649 RepID=UPI000E1F89F0|nr:tRNA (adenosine(37)-N6)-threonylcarbamoyltransferase complex ATPase subunit type 1 TsaE [Helicobacter sp. MIT 14-3879]RDU64655.1 tRNA (adenosine(37)-N6)-threonylcarbamoyltransferase complex ATPase subunit type 1 TsaE [Helicobacter sp. MIT 14-3879]